MGDKQRRSLVTSMELTLIGGVGGVMEVCVMQPMMAMKNALQEGRPIPTRPRELYRGLLINCGSMMPITATQFGTNRAIEQFLLRRSPTGTLSPIGTFACAAVAGGVSALVATPTELIIIQQQKKGTALVEECRSFARTHRPVSLFRGLGPCMAREALYAAGYLGLCPILYERLRKSEALEAYPMAPMFLAGVAGGIFGASASHPFDTIKTRMQAFMYTKPEYLTVPQTAVTIYKEGGVLRFWRGLLPRMTRIVGATFILINVRSTAVEYLESLRDEPAVDLDLPAVTL